MVIDIGFILLVERALQKVQRRVTPVAVKVLLKVCDSIKEASYVHPILLFLLVRVVFVLDFLENLSFTLRIIELTLEFALIYDHPDI